MITTLSILAINNRNIDFLFIKISLGFLVGFCFAIYQLFGLKPFREYIRYNLLIIF